MTPGPRPRQGDLFPIPPPPSGLPSPEEMPFERQQLVAWQERLAAYQGPLWEPSEAPEVQQASLPFAAAAAPDPDNPLSGCPGEARASALRPLSLPAVSLTFWRWPQAPHQGPVLYLVLDRPAHLAQPLLLYVGETARADRRWKGSHDCKSYLAAYQEALSRADLSATLSIRFWCEAPAATSERRALEQALIQRWKPPFNKETRGRWSTPFTAEAD